MQTVIISADREERIRQIHFIDPVETVLDLQLSGLNVRASADFEEKWEPIPVEEKTAIVLDFINHIPPHIEGINYYHIC